MSMPHPDAPLQRDPLTQWLRDAGDTEAALASIERARAAQRQERIAALALWHAADRSTFDHFFTEFYTDDVGLLDVLAQREDLRWVWASAAVVAYRLLHVSGARS